LPHPPTTRKEFVADVAPNLCLDAGRHRNFPEFPQTAASVSILVQLPRTLRAQRQVSLDGQPLIRFHFPARVERQEISSFLAVHDSSLRILYDAGNALLDRTDAIIVSDFQGLSVPDGLEQFSGAVESPAHRRVRTPDDLGDLFTGESLDIAKSQNGFVLGGQLIQGRVNPPPKFAVFTDLGRTLGLVRHSAYFPQIDRSISREFAESVDAKINHDLVEPRIEVFLEVESAEIAKHTEECLLGDVLGRFVVVEEVIGDPIGPTLITLHEIPERLFTTLLAPADEFDFLGVGQARTSSTGSVL